MESVQKFKEFEFHGNKLATPTVFLQYKGVWDMDNLYKTTADFLRQQKFKFYEKMQRQRKPGPFGVERLYSFEGIRDVDEHHRWHVYVKLETFDERDVEVMNKDGTKKTMSEGRVWIRIWGTIVLDYEKKWERSYFTLHLRKFYNKFIIKKRIEFIYWDKLYYNVVLKLHGVLSYKLKTESRGNEHKYSSGLHG